MRSAGFVILLDDEMKDECEISVFCMRVVPSVIYSPSRARLSQQSQFSSCGNYNRPTVDSAESWRFSTHCLHRS